MEPEWRCMGPAEKWRCHSSYRYAIGNVFLPCTFFPKNLYPVTVAKNVQELPCWIPTGHERCRFWISKNTCNCHGILVCRGLEIQWGFQKTFKDEVSRHSFGDTNDGRTLAPVEVGSFFPVFARLYGSPGGAGFLPSTVSLLQYAWQRRHLEKKSSADLSAKILAEDNRSRKPGKGIEISRRWCSDAQKHEDQHIFLGGGFNFFFIFTPKIGEDFRFWPIFFKGVGSTTDQSVFFVRFFYPDEAKAWCSFPKAVSTRFDALDFFSWRMVFSQKKSRNNILCDFDHTQTFWDSLKNKIWSWWHGVHHKDLVTWENQA